MSSIVVADQRAFRNQRISEIAALFPGAVVTNDADGFAQGFKLQGEEKLWVSYNGWGAKGHRFHISCCWVQSKVDGTQFTCRDVSRGEAPGISVDADKSNEQIKRDIERRLLPDYRALLVQVIDRRDNHDRYILGRNKTARAVAGACGGSVWGQGHYPYNVSLPCGGNAEASDSSVSFKFSVSVERAQELAALLAKWHAQDVAKEGVAA